jgi:hypothetical protein
MTVLSVSMFLFKTVNTWKFLNSFAQQDARSLSTFCIFAAFGTGPITCGVSVVGSEWIERASCPTSIGFLGFTGGGGPILW